MALHTAVRDNDIEAVRRLIGSGADINEVDKLSRTSLHMAAWAGNFEILKLLVASKANLMAKAVDNFSALHFAVQSSSEHAVDCVKLLVKRDKRLLNQKVSKGNKTALHVAASKVDTNLF